MYVPLALPPGACSAEPSATNQRVGTERGLLATRSILVVGPSSSNQLHSKDNRRRQGSALNGTYTLYGLGVHYVQAEGGEPGITTCMACANPV